MLPLVVLKVLGGPIIDRLGARRVSIGCDLGSALVVGAIPAAAPPRPADLPGCSWRWWRWPGALRGPGDGAKHGAGADPGRARRGADRAGHRACTAPSSAPPSMLGAALAGGLVAVVGPTNALVVDAASFARLRRRCSPGRRTALRAARPQTASTGRRTAGAGLPSTSQLREGWDFLRGDRVLLAITVMVALTNLLDLAYAAVLVPVWARGVRRRRGGDRPALRGVQRRRRRSASLAAPRPGPRGCRATGPTWSPSWSPALPRFVVLALGVPAVGGAGRSRWPAASPPGFLNPVLGAVIFERIPAPLVGRVTSLTTALCFAADAARRPARRRSLSAASGCTRPCSSAARGYFLVTMLPAVDPRRDGSRPTGAADPTSRRRPARTR